MRHFDFLRAPFQERFLRAGRPAGGLLLVLLALGAGPVAAQRLNYDAVNVQNLPGTYTDLGTAGTAIATANFDDANSGVQAIGFSFSFNNTSPAATTFTLNTNGFIKLGSMVPSSPFQYPQYAQAATPGGPLGGSDTTSVNIVAPFATDLMAGSAGGTQYRVATTGAAPNRVCTVQWKNVADKPRQASATDTFRIGTQYGNFSFQVKLYETSGQIDFVYGPATAGSGADAFRTATVGIKGSSVQAGSLVTVNKGSTGPWTGAGAFASLTPHNVRRSVLPDAGRTYRFRTNAVLDAAVQAVLTLGQLPVGTPHAVQAVIRNVGTQTLTNLPVQLDVNGPNRSAAAVMAFTNTQIIASLAPGASTTVTFAPYTVGTRVGTNTIDVTLALPGDGYPATNAATATQAITVNSFGHAAPLAAGVVPSFYGFDTRAGITAVRYTAPRATTITAVTNFVPTGSNSVGRTIYAIAADAAGNILGSTPDYVVRAADLGTTVTCTFATPVPVGAVDFLVGIAQRASTVAHYPVGLLVNTPTRAGAFYDRGALTSGPFSDVSTRGFGPFLIGAVATNTVLSAANAAPRLAFALAPNPAHGTALLLLPAAATAAQAVQVLDALGRPESTLALPAGATQAALPVADLARGLYVVRVGASSQRLVVE